MSISGTANFANTHFEQHLSFTESRVSLFNIAEIESEHAEFHSVDLTRLSYDRLLGDWRKLFALFERSLLKRDSQPDFQSYTQLEQSLRKAGYDREADDAYLLPPPRGEQNQKGPAISTPSEGNA
jgi:hypothetical protein